MCMPKFQILVDGKVAYHIDSKDEATSNWMRFVNSASNYDEQNMRVEQYKKGIYYITNRTIEPGSELLIYYGDGYAEDHGILPPNSGKKAQIFQYHNVSEVSLCSSCFPLLIIKLTKNSILKCISGLYSFTLLPFTIQ